MDNFVSGSLSASLCSSSAENECVITALSPGVLAHAGSVSAAPHLCVACMSIFNLHIYI